MHRYQTNLGGSVQQHLPKEASWLRTFIGEFLKMGRKSHTYVHICSCSDFIKYSIHIYIYVYLYNLCHSWEEACSIQRVWILYECWEAFNYMRLTSLQEESTPAYVHMYLCASEQMISKPS